MSEEELLELLVSLAPDSLEGWLAIVVTASAFLSYILPKPKEDAPILIRTGHKIISVLGLGATKLRAAGKVGQILHKREKKL